eukprot:2660350-Pyramimonas_sp.AAC.1
MAGPQGEQGLRHAKRTAPLRRARPEASANSQAPPARDSGGESSCGRAAALALAFGFALTFAFAFAFAFAAALLNTAFSASMGQASIWILSTTSDPPLSKTQGILRCELDGRVGTANLIASPTRALRSSADMYPWNFWMMKVAMVFMLPTTML